MRGIFQKRKHHTSFLLKAFQISFIHFLLHRHFKHYVYGKRQTVDSCVSQNRENLRFSTCLTLLRSYSIYLVIKFSTSDNAFCVLWLVHSILVISSYTLVSPYMVNECAKRCWAKNVFPGKRYFSLNKAKKEKKNFLWKVWINADV